MRGPFQKGAYTIIESVFGTWVVRNKAGMVVFESRAYAQVRQWLLNH